MDFNKFQIYRKHAPLDPILVKEWLEPKIHRFKQLAEQKQQLLQLDDIADSLTILGDRTVLDSILDNLLTNSIKYTPQGGNVTVSVEAGSHKVYIRVIRMEHAASLLRQGHSISEVSFETGFANVKYFSSVFKSYFGIVPSKYS